jgi:hypothetical protein
MNLKKVSGDELKSDYEWLKKHGCGCCFHHICDSHTKNMYHLMGWHDNGENFVIAVKIGMQHFSAPSQSDFDFDFIIPFNERTEEMYDTLRVVDENEDWNALAEYLNNEAENAVAFQIIQEETVD